MFSLDYKHVLEDHKTKLTSIYKHWACKEKIYKKASHKITVFEYKTEKIILMFQS